MDKIKLLLSGKIVDFELKELVALVRDLNFYNINTLLMQQSMNGKYVCKVDSNTVKGVEKMSEKYKSWIESLKDSPIGSYEHNCYLCHKYDWLYPRNIFGLIVSDYDYSYTLLDDMPVGWKKAFGLKFCEEIQEALDKTNETNFEILQIKEKYGSLRFYCKPTTKEVYKVIKKYEKLSERTCINCGAPATRITTDWINPWCDECLPIEGDVSLGRKAQSVSIEDWFKEVEDEL